MFGEKPDKLPLTVYEMLFPRGLQERLLRNKDVGLIFRPPAHTVAHREVQIESREYWESGRKLVRRTIKTPVGEVWQILEPDVRAYEGNTWILEHFIKTPDDYRVVEYYFKDAVYSANFGYLSELIRRIGGDGLVYVRISKSPIQEMLYQIMGMERFSIDYYERRDLFDSLHQTILEKYRELFDLACESPVEILLLGENITSEVVGNDRYRYYLMPVYKELKDRMSGTGKLLGVHIDGKVASLADEVAESAFDIVEAFTPPPMGDFPVSSARERWTDKALWINFTSSVLLEQNEAVKRHTRQILKEAGTSRGFAIGVTENAPVPALEKSLLAISEVIEEFGTF
jgi:hypothetical protein